MYPSLHLVPVLHFSLECGELVPLWIREGRKLSAVWKARPQAKICLNASRFPGLIQSSAWPEHSKFAKLELGRVCT